MCRKEVITIKNNVLYRSIKKIYEKIISFLSVLSPVLATKVLYFKFFHKRLDLNNPRTLNEKILWLKLNTYNHNPLVTQCADKYRVREYIKSTGCGAILNELYAVWDTPDEIIWDSLPDRFVLKCNHGCGYNIICPDKKKLDTKVAHKQLKAWLKEDYWKLKAEVNYKAIEKKIICEKFIDGENQERLNDYKVYCFNGKAQCVLVCTNKDRKFYFYDRDWNLLRINPDSKNAPESFSLKKPNRIDQVFRYAEILSEPFPFVRVDFYVENEVIIFGEMTFTPAAGLDTKRLYDTDVYFGDLLKL